MALTWMSHGPYGHGTHMDASWHTFEWVMWMSLETCMSQVMAHMWMSHGTFRNEVKKKVGTADCKPKSALSVRKRAWSFQMNSLISAKVTYTSCKYILYFRKRVLCFRKRGLFVHKREKYFCKRTFYSLKRALLAPRKYMHCNTLNDTTTHCNTINHTATH